MGKLYGYKRWYGFREQGEKFDRKVKIKRKYDEIKGKYNIKIDEVNNQNKIKNDYFIKKLKEYKEKNGEKISSKFNKGNVLFKLKMNENNEFLEAEKIISKVELLSRSEELSKKIKRKKLEELIKKKVENKEIDQNTEEFEINTEGIEEVIKVDNSEGFDRTQSGYVVKWKKLNEDEVRIKREIYGKFQEINEKIYGLMIDLSDTKNIRIKKEYLEKKYYKEYLKNILLEKKNIEEIKKIFKKIKGFVNNDININGFISFYSNIGEDKKGIENKKIFVNKILYYIRDNTELTDKDVVDYIIEELQYWDIIKRVEKVKSFNKTLEKIYIKYDKHEKLKKIVKDKKNKKNKKNEKDKKNEIVKHFIDDIKNDLMREKIKKILDKFKIEELVKKLKEKTENKNFDTEIFDTYKEHYKSIIGKTKFNCMCNDEKELYKIVYRYIKGRVDKILINRKKKDLDSKIKDWFNEENLLEKIEKRVKQYTLEHVMYLGKIKHRGLKEEEINTLKFQELHGQEELELELITFFSAVNMELNKFIEKNTDENEEKIIDFFGGVDNKKWQTFEFKKEFLNSKTQMFKNLKFIDEEEKFEIQEKSDFWKFLKEVTNLRNNILHATFKEIESLKKMDFKSKYNDLKKIIENLKVSSEDISKTLYLDGIFENKKELIEKINEINKNNFEENIEKKYFPSFSKIVSDIVKIIKDNNKNNSIELNVERIMLNGAIYVNKVLYNKLISNKNSGFMQKIQAEFSKKTISECYREAQISASKGNKRAIQKYQNEIKEKYIDYIKRNFEGILNFSKFEKTISEIRDDIKLKSNSAPKIVLDINDRNITIKNDFEYIVSVLSLLSNNVFINKIRNRFFSTEEWIKNENYDNICNLLDEIMEINFLKEEAINNTWNPNLKEFLENEKNKKANNERVNREFENKTKENIFVEYYDVIKEKVKFEVSKVINDTDIENLIDKELKEIIIFERDNEKNENEIIKITFEKLTKESKGILDKINNKKFRIGDKSFVKVLENIIKEKRNEELQKKLENIVIDPIIIEKYKDIIDDLIENNKQNNNKQNNNKQNFEEIYYQKEEKDKEREEKLYIYKKNLFLNIGNPNFDNIYGLISEYIKTADAKKLLNGDIRNNKILEVNKVLKNLNDKLNGYSKDFKDKYIEKLKEKDNNFFAKNIKSEKYKSFEEFEKDYNEVSEYKKIRDLVEFNYLNKIESYLIDINWKLAIQIARFERDVHYIVNGLEELGEIKIEDEKEKKVSRAYKKYKDRKLQEESYYKFKNDECVGGVFKDGKCEGGIYKNKEYEKFENICLSLGIDLTVDSEVQKKGKENIRNYISHFYIIRESFKKYSLAKQIDKVSKLMEYSTRYNNSIYNSIFEVFKKDVDLSYDNLKKKFKLHVESNSSAEVFNITDLIKPKKVSVLELEHYNSEFVMKLIEKMLTKKL